LNNALTRFTSSFAREKVSKYAVFLILVGTSFLWSASAKADNIWLASNGNVSGNSVQFDYRGGSATYVATVADNSTVSVTVNNMIANCIGTCSPIPDVWTVSINGQSYSGNTIEITTLTAQVSGALTIAATGIDAGFWGGWYGPIISVSITEPVVVVEPTPSPVASSSPDSSTVVVTPETPTVTSETQTVTSETQTSIVDSPTVVVSDTSVVTTETVTVLDTVTVTSESSTQTSPQETTTVVAEVPSLPTPAPEPVAVQPAPVRPEPIVVPEPALPAPSETDPAPIPAEEPPVVAEEPPLPEEEPPAVEEEPPVAEEPPPAEEEPAPPVEEEAPLPLDEEPVQEQPEPMPEPSPEPIAELEPPSPPDIAPEPPIVAAPNATEAEKEIVAQAIIEQAQGEPVTAQAIADAGLTYSDLPPETPVEVRQDENGNEVVITAEVAAALVILADPAALVEALFTDPTQALLAVASIGADMSDEERAESEKIIVASVIAGQAAITAAGAVAAAAYRRNP